MLKIHYQTAPQIFEQGFEKNYYKYPAKCSKLNFKRPRQKLFRSKFRACSRCPSIWNNFLKLYKKEIKSSPLFFQIEKNKYTVNIPCFSFCLQRDEVYL